MPPTTPSVAYEVQREHCLRQLLSNLLCTFSEREKGIASISKLNYRILMIAIFPFKGSITSQRISCIFLVDRIIELLNNQDGC